MKILNIFNHYVEGGGEASAVRAISDSISHMFDLKSCDFFSADWIGKDAPAAWKQAMWMLRNPQSLERIRGCHDQFQPDAWLVHNVFPVGSAAIYTEAKRRGVPIIQYLHNFRPFSVNGSLWAGGRIQPGGLSGNYLAETWHGAWQNSRLKTAWLAMILLMMQKLGWLKSVKTWIAISEFIRSKFITTGIPPEDIFMLRYFWRVRPCDPSESTNSHYLFLGRLIEAKGILPLLDAWKILESEKSGVVPRLLIAGNGPLRDLVIHRTERMKSVQYVGELHGDAKDQAVKNARALIIPSVWWEPLGLVVYEAYEAHRPVLAARSGGLPEIVLDRQTGLLHQPGNAAQLAEQVRQLETDDRIRLDMGGQGRIWLERNASETQWRETFATIAAHAISRRD